MSNLVGLLAAVGIGLLIGLERGWRQRDEHAGGRIAGIRTYALLALGLAVVFSIVRLINFAHGEVMTIAGYAIWLALLSSVPVVAAIALGIIVAMLALLNPLAVIGTAIFVAGIFVGSDAMSRAAGVPTYIADMLMASALLFMVLAILLTKMRVVRG